MSVNESKNTCKNDTLTTVNSLIKSSPADKIKGVPKKTPQEAKNWICDIVNRLFNDWIPHIAPAFFTEVELIELCYRGRESFWQEKGIIKVTPPVTIVGDIHGQFQDLKAILIHNGCPPEQKYVFLGDYVDRGPFSIECITLLLALRILYPDNVILLRGNHESQPVNMHYGFFEECKKRYSTSLYEAFQRAFNCLPFCANIGGKILCMHGGITNEINSLKELELIDIPCEISELGVLAELTWADPSNDKKHPFYCESPRGAGHLFGPLALNDFLNLHKLNMVVRGHQVVQDGYEFFGDKRLATIFSAPTYTGTHKNFGAIMHVSNNFTISFTCFKDKIVDNENEDKDKTKEIKKKKK
ncbi:Calcineurin-like phosphoesterase domain, apaH type and Serine/threonine-specific protein phosphatase/bis(5-nucleosyl)-tetraphosphatase domain-containing protein [Strongyloides ratti]|uniref:Serine/threonine-protein phosphatase n=1 Tax=Strongyloides ratti TaxID=34506 RepID=A0A090LB72_STRRB|nr:Calcineurin-like phosphoesterase domain, apaH type and Serine/threonine-specific protein phosphatase/bis(5-nucleosyl)-tetraphosphatase domain-containing protein [Strongyloides ratti]CEF65373.1 Calcineurin-like phosphoesterase domain, apaH type and Serine/threonine-specific protein phosphatase/bis(5-nucleosyl)-tetraphosphatase domain-containing protein [Strongyloides ratti]